MPEQPDLAAFLATVEPFDRLPDDVRAGIAGLLTEQTYKKDSLVYHQDTSKVRTLDIIVDGGYEAFFYDSEHQKRLPVVYGPGTAYGGLSILLNKKRSLRTVIAQKGTRVLQLPRRDFRALCQAYAEFFHWFTGRYGQLMLNDEYAHFVKRTRGTEENFITADELFTRKIETVETREIVSVPFETPIYLAAQVMSYNKVSCLFVTEGAGGPIVGYVTDIVLRDRVVGGRQDPHEPVATVMARPIVTISTEDYVHDAILRMFETKTRYLVVQKDGVDVGFLSRNRLLADQAQTPFLFIQAVKQAQSTRELKRRWEQVPEIVYQLLNRGVKADIVNQVITVVADSIAQKVIEDVIVEHGPPPAKFAFIVLGSEGRKEQTLLTDQDNAIIYEDKANEQRELVRAYFLRFAAEVSDRLDHIGFSYCTGGFMAKNPEWTHSLSHWKRTYRAWMQESNPETVMKTSTFFDCRFLYGSEGLVRELQDFLRQELTAPLDLFLYRMAVNALQYEPPQTTWFTRIFTKGVKQSFDIKKAMTPIVDLVRVYALRHQIFRTNTGERMTRLRDLGVFTEKECQELQHAYYYLMGMRLKNQARQRIDDAQTPTNTLDPATLTQVEQVTLREIFKVISAFQLKIRVSFTGSL